MSDQQNKHPATRLWILLACLLLSACQPQGVVEFGYQPPLVPVRISVNSRGEVSASASYTWVTPLGTFDIGGGVSVNTLRNKFSSNVLIVRVDNQATVYELKEGAHFEITFDDRNTLYKKVAFHKEPNGDFILELERAVSAEDQNQPGSASSSSNPASTNTKPSSSPDSCPGAPKQRLKVGDNAYVCTKVDTVALREGPSKNYTIIKRLVPGADLKIIGGPTCANNWSFWQVRTESGYTGWMSEGGDSKDKYFLCPK